MFSNFLKNFTKQGAVPNAQINHSFESNKQFLHYIYHKIVYLKAVKIVSVQFNVTHHWNQINIFIILNKN